MISNKTSKQFFRIHDPGCKLTNIKNLFFKELSDFKSILEFGCNNGNNLLEIRKLYPDMEIHGIDINKEVVERVRIQGREFVEHGDEYSLQFIASKSYDVIFTNSVLSHLPKIADIIEQFQRIAKKKIVLIETNEHKGRYYFDHRYQNFHFKIKRSMKNPEEPIGNGAMYDYWE